MSFGSAEVRSAQDDSVGVDGLTTGVWL